MRRLVFLLLYSFFAIITQASAVSAAERTISPSLLDSRVPVYGNPYMGWVMEYATIEGLPYPPNHECMQMRPKGSFYPEFEVIELISTWGDIEREEGVFDWSRLDAAFQYWVSKGKRIRLRVSNDDYGPYYSVPRDRLGTPDWLYRRYGIEKQIRSYDGAHGWQFPNVGHAVYQQKLANFLLAMAERYKESPALEVVSLRGYGAWAEWHDGYVFSSEDLKATALRQIIDVWMNAWTGSKKLLSLPVAIDCAGQPWESAFCNSRKNADYAGFKYRLGYDYAMNLPLLTFNKDCVGNCTTPNEYQLLSEAFAKKKLPLIGEFAGFYRDYKNGIGGRSMDFAKDDVFKQRLNYITALGWSCDLHDADAFYAEQKGFINSVMLKLGYRLSLTKVILPSSLVKGKSFRFQHWWRNEGVGRFYGPVALKIYLQNQAGEIAWEGMTKGLDLTGILKDQADIMLSSQFVITNELPAGKYKLKIALVDRLTGLPKIKLANQGRDAQGRYLLGTIKIVGSAMAN